MNSKGSITLVAYSRHNELEACLQAIDVARENWNIPLVVVHQVGFPEVHQVLEKWSNRIDVMVRTRPQGNTPLMNINLNGLLSREIAFKWMRCDWSIGIEEDTIIAPDAVNFVVHCFEKYRRNPFFRGVNLGSKNRYSEGSEGLYSQVSYGVQGQASMLTNRTWSHFNINRIQKKLDKSGLDSLMEHFVKSGFMCTPHNSRYLDFGWNGTHASPDPENEHYVRLEESFSKVDSKYRGPYLRQKTSINWREDAKPFVYWKSLPRYVLCKVQHLKYLIRKLLKKA